MHIGFRTSGGRGEYEVVGSHSNFTAASLEGWEFYMRWPDGRVRSTGLWLDPGDSGKPRLRSLFDKPIQIGKIITSMLLMPDPTRSYKDTPLTTPIAVAKQYTVTQVGFGPESEFTDIADRVTFVPSWVEVANTGGRDAIGVTARWNRISAVYEQSASLPTPVRTHVDAHRDYLATGEAIHGKLETIVKKLDKALVLVPGALHSGGHDVLVGLERLLNIPPSIDPDLPAPNELSEDEIEINVRSAHQYRLAKVRGAAGRKFSEDVRAAYGHRCAFCGSVLGGIEGVYSGVDAAHILAWSRHDLDTVSNGIALCKLHHWAFDAGILLLKKEDGEYRMRFTTLADRIDPRSLDRLGAEGESIPIGWLPEDPAQWPSEQYLNLAYADIGVTFKDDV